MGHKCDCATPNFVEIKLDIEKRARYEQLQKLIAEMNKKKKEYDDLQLAISRQKREKIEKKDRRVVGEYEQFFKNHNINNNDKKSKNEDPSKYRIVSLKYFAPNRPYKKI